MITISKTTEITKLFYEEHLRPTDIAKQIGVGKSYVTKIIQKDERYIKEKECRAIQSRDFSTLRKGYFFDFKESGILNDFKM